MAGLLAHGAPPPPPPPPPPLLTAASPPQNWGPGEGAHRQRQLPPRPVGVGGWGAANGVGARQMWRAIRAVRRGSVKDELDRRRKEGGAPRPGQGGLGRRAGAALTYSGSAMPSPKKIACRMKSMATEASAGSSGSGPRSAMDVGAGGAWGAGQGLSGCWGLPVGGRRTLQNWNCSPAGEQHPHQQRCSGRAQTAARPPVRTSSAASAAGPPSGSAAGLLVAVQGRTTASGGTAVPGAT